MWAMMWATMIARLIVDNGRVDGGRWKKRGMMMLFCVVLGNIFNCAVSLLSNLETARQERSVLLLVEQKLLVKEGKSGCI